MMPRHIPGGGADGSGEIMLFGVRVKVDPMRKSVSMNNLSQYQQQNVNLNNDKSVHVSAAVSYASDVDAVRRHSGAGRERKRGIPWTEEEHKLFLLGLEKVGKGDWKGISRNFVKTRTPTQVASHAQKYFLRKSNLNRKRHRSSLFDITSDSVAAIPMEEEHGDQDNVLQQAPETPNIAVAPCPVSVGPVVNTISGQVNDTSPMFSGSISVLPFIESPAPSSAIDSRQTSTNIDPTLSLNLSLSYDLNNLLPSRQSVYKAARNLSNGDGMIRVA